uniref:Uncharacterized protein n=1 Tax=Salmonella phage vB_STmST313_KE27 TaxID=3161178 RepID=A0AAU8GJ31_9CAUD
MKPVVCDYCGQPPQYVGGDAVYPTAQTSAI